MIAGLPWESWLLLLVSGGAGLGLVAVFHLRHREGRGPRRRRDRNGGGPREGSRGASRGTSRGGRGL